MPCLAGLGVYGRIDETFVILNAPGRVEGIRSGKTFDDELIAAAVDLAELRAAGFGLHDAGNARARHRRSALGLLVELGIKGRRNAAQPTRYPAWLILGVEGG